jgi:hypothetical protein
VNSNNVILDDIWAWRADHGNGVGWTGEHRPTPASSSTATNVTAYGLFVEHYQKTETVWNGNGGRVTFFQNEMPYDPPDQASWQEAPGVDGYPALKVTDGVARFTGYGMGSYSFFNQGVDIFAANAFVVPETLPAIEPERPAHDLPRPGERQGRHPQRDQRHRRVLDDREPGRPGHRRELPVAEDFPGLNSRERASDLASFSASRR